MKLKSLYIEKYKNLSPLTIDFEAGNGLTMLVGNNGSGKSNVLEAISGIFHDLFKGKDSRKIKCDYKLVYTLNEVNCKIERTDGFLRCYGPKFKRREYFIEENAPNNIIGLYSGEEDRLWTSFYESYYKAYIKRIKTNQHQERMRLMLINKYYWNVALLTLLLSKNETLKPFIENDLSITSIAKIELRFNFKYFDDINELLKTFIDRINPDHKSKIEYSLEDLRNNIFYSVLTDENGDILVDEHENKLLAENGVTDTEVFQNLTQAYMPKNEKIIRDIIIRIDDDITVEQLSEGEKKLILVKTVLEILSDEKTLVLMDEPDAHLHEIRKKNLYSMMGEYPNRQIVIATHSPTFIDVADQNQIKMLKLNDSGKAMLYEEEKLEAIRKLTGSRINAFLERPILYCEGTETSVESILYPLLFPNYKIVPAGGHEEVIYLTKTYNRTFGDTTHYAIGIIDWDYKTEAQISALKNEKIYALKVVEVENVLMDLVLLEAAKNEFCAEEDCLEKAKQSLFNDCRKHKAYQATKYTSNNIVSQIKSGISPEGGSIEKIKQRIQDVCDITKVDSLYNERVQCLDEYLREGKFENLVSIYDFGHNIDRFLNAVVNNYQSRILKLIERRTDLQESIKLKYYSEIK
ncbi:AAA family ATPase [Flavonifractor plautii]|uniref:AAA family ATPase n=1 Tax=Flavonifractor plautii TaxID=292800 RepID=UPI00195B4886|nr:ATP-binding protein [uncultured Flavonifractor sp.]MBM6790067.1 AAA family ATPase [Flavonifractor plautii]MCR1922335.1 AAA family ATPase [Flavonifractor plautii]